MHARLPMSLAAGLVVLATLPHARAQGPAPARQIAYLKASNTEPGDGFGVCAVSGDTLVVGAALEWGPSAGVNGSQGNSTSSARSGAVYVFVRSGDAFVQQAYIKASNPQFGAVFGGSVAISGDTIAVGAPGEGGGATGVNGDQTAVSGFSDSGAVYVFVRDGATWTQQAYVKASNTGGGDAFGTSVSISGDMLVVGAPGERSSATGVDGDQSDDSVPDSGAGYVFVRDGATWTQAAYLKGRELLSIPSHKRFGTSVSTHGERVLVGAPAQGDLTWGPRAGRAYVFVRNGAAWVEEALLRASNAGDHDDFGSSVALFGDTAVVGARFEDSPATGVDGDQADDGALWSGAAYVFARDASGWSQAAYLKASNTGASDRFGSAVALSGSTIVVGAHREDSAARGIDGNGDNDSTADSGAAYVFTRSGNRWSQRAYVKPSNTGRIDSFGLVAVDGEAVLIGAPGEASAAVGVGGSQGDNSAPNAGAAYAFDVLSAATFCSGDGSDAACPCGNTGLADAGCDNAAGTGGVALDASGSAAQNSVVLEGSGFPLSNGPAVIAIRSSSTQSPAVVFGDGLRCVGTTGLVRVGVGLASGGGAFLPIAHGAGPGEFFYQLWYRSNPASFCAPQAFNLSNGLSLAWPQ